MSVLDAVGRLSVLSMNGILNDPAVLRALSRMPGSGGSGRGVIELLQGCREAGLADDVSSWVSAGQNLPISSEQLQQRFGVERLQRLGQSSGVTECEAATSLSRLLPMVVDWLSPEGELAQPRRLEQLVAPLTRAFGG